MAPLSRSDYQIGIICALPLERTAVQSILDIQHDPLPTASGDNNTYSYGCIGQHNVVVASLGAGGYGTVSAGVVASDMRRSFEAIKYGLMVGIAGGMPRPGQKDGDIRLGDVVVGCANGVPSVINYRLGKETSNGFDIRSELAEPPSAIQSAVSALISQHQTDGPTYLVHLHNLFENNPRLNNARLMEDYFNQPEEPDCLYATSFEHPLDKSDCSGCSTSEHLVARQTRYLREPPQEIRDVARIKFIKYLDGGLADYPKVHPGTVASADTLMKNGAERDAVYQRVKSQRKADVLCFEMEAAGIVKNWPCLVIRGICDYSDSHKNDAWQNFAAATAAAYAKDLLLKIQPEVVERAPLASDVLDHGE